jgi:hypothetical protein
VLAAALSLAACSSASPAASPSAPAASPSVPATTARPATGPATSAATAPTAATAAAAPPSTRAPATAGSTTLVPMQTAAGGEFLSPSGNISCEIDYHRAGLTQAYCQTITPARSATMDITGRYTTCTGQQCLGNPGTGTPTLAYGTATGVGPFRCKSATSGVTCTADGKGFQISASGITPVPG